MLTIDDIRQIVSEGAWQSFMGESESEILDCKKVPYRLDELQEKDELAKDVSSFANAGGGFILLGLETKPSSTHPTDEVCVLRPFGNDRVDPKQYRDILRDWIVPEIEGISVRWVPRSAGASDGFGVLEVPRQAGSRQPFIITRPVQEDGRRRGLFVGFVQRKGAESPPAGPVEIAQWLRDGRNYQERIESRLEQIGTAIEELRSGGVGPGGPGGIPPDQVQTRVDDALGVTGLVNRPHYVLSAWPNPASGVDPVSWTLDPWRRRVPRCIG